ncbi:MAG: PorP/SprF family type IX secretion system membrane protein [Bacteroidia bacterium]|nr:PorP/SprF family type IX secretion system membrane protein [Bacteroidia bacterium]
MSGIRRFILALLLLFGFFPISAQDIHFSQFYSSPLNLNPATTGNFDGQYRFIANDRNQWQSFTNGYRTFSASFDSKWILPGLVNSAAGAGLIINSDKAGDGNFGFTQIGLAVSFHYDLTGTGKNIISAGVCPSFSQYSIDFSKFNFNSQFNGDYYDPGIPANENLSAGNFTFFDLSAGAGISSYINEKYSVNSGFSVQHLLSPTVSFYDNSGVKLNPRFNIHAMVEYHYRPDITIYPSFMFSKQGVLREFTWGGMTKLSLNNLIVQSLYFGGWNRWGDAIILKTGADYQNVNIGISYDFNISSLTRASNGMGGFEFSMAYIFNLRRIMPPVPFKQCPTFI